MSDNDFIDSLPETIRVSTDILKNKGGRPSTEARRRKSTPVQGKVKGRRNHFTNKEKLNAVCVFAVAGNSRRVAELTKIPEATIRSWKQTEWWNEAMNRIITEQDEELSSDMTKLINKAVVQIEDRIQEGDYVYNVRTGELARKPMSGKDLMHVTSMTIDKRQLLRGQPTSRIEKISTDERLKSLAEEFKKFANAKTIVQEDSLDAIEEGEIEENNLPEYQDGDEEWEATEAGDSNSDDESWEEQDELEEEQEEETLTVDEMFTE